jgi:hypothetical protein
MTRARGDSFPSALANPDSMAGKPTSKRSAQHNRTVEKCRGAALDYAPFARMNRTNEGATEQAKAAVGSGYPGVAPAPCVGISIGCEGDLNGAVRRLQAADGSAGSGARMELAMSAGAKGAFTTGAVGGHLGSCRAARTDAKSRTAQQLPSWGGDGHTYDAPVCLRRYKIRGNAPTHLS